MKQLLRFVLVLIIPAVALSQQEPEPTCTNGKVYQTCGSACPMRCGSNQPPFCTFQCVAGCFCPSGLAESGDGCVAPSDCPVATTPPPPPPVCPSGMIHETCGSACPLTCENRNEPSRPCPLICVQGCFCPSGMAEHQGSCYIPDQCPVHPPPDPTPPPTPPPTPTCTNNMVYSTCGTACPLTCANRNNPPQICPAICVIGCTCPFGMAEYEGTCYQPDNCPITVNTTIVTTAPPPPTRPTPPTCANGMTYNSCGTACPLTCEHPFTRPCPRICARGCFCPEGQLQFEGRCVERQDCPSNTTVNTTAVTPPPPTPPTCANGMIHETCGTFCPLTCENRNDPPRPCPFICVQGCFCPPGMAEYQGSCYVPDQCPEIPTPPPTPPPTPTCTNNMVYSTCGTACPLTCANRNNPPQICPAICVIGCTCPNGMAEYQGACYEPDSCPIPANPTCTNGKTFNSCGTACPLTCEHPFPRPCPRICERGCFCPEGLLQFEGRCVERQDCPVRTNTTTAPAVNTTAPQPTAPTTCFNGMVFQSCGTSCPPTCDDPNPGFCTLDCIEGCFCPTGMLMHMGRCVRSEECPSVATTEVVATPPPPPTCTNGMVFNSCGTACPLTCDQPNPRPCIRICMPGCFCPDGLLQSDGVCVEQSDCPAPTPTPHTCPEGKEYRECGPVCPPSCAPTLNPCFSLRCFPGCFCPEGQMEHEGRCVSECPLSTVPPPPVDPCKDANCRDDQVCEVQTSGCGPEDSYCSHYALCKNPPYVPCGRDAFLACDSEWTYCLQQNKTRRADCVADCFSRNGNCDDDDVCITTVEEGRPRIQCVETDDLSSECPAGQVMDNSDCPTPCQETCDDVVEGTGIACAAVCAEPSCICPEGLVRFRDRCVDPRLCYVLTTYPPPIKPLPIVDSNTVLLSLYSRDVDRHQFMMRDQQHRLTSSIQNTLARYGHDGVDVSFHGAHDDDNQLHIVIQLSGSSISRASVDDLISILNENSDDLDISVQFGQVEVMYVDDDMDLSRNAIIGIAVSSGVAGIAVIVAWIAVVACCCVLRGKRRTAPPPTYSQAQGEKLNPNVFYQEKDLSMDPEKGKLVLESLCD